MMKHQKAKKLLKICLRNNSTFNQNNFNITNPIKYKHKTTKAQTFINNDFKKNKNIIYFINKPKKYNKIITMHTIPKNL